jgi:1,4-dihydroxy-2-naphthoate octaprenyltransferase
VYLCKVLTPEDIVNAFCVSVCVSLAAFSGLVWLIAPALTSSIAEITALYVTGIIGSILYTAGPFGLKYYALGDVTVFLVSGPIAVLFAYLGQGGSLASWPTVVCYSVSVGLNVTSILHCQNTRDIRTDARANFLTVAILLGENASSFYFAFLIFAPYVCYLYLFLVRSSWFLLPFLLFWGAIVVQKRFSSGSFKNLERQTVMMNFPEMLFYVAALCLE